MERQVFADEITEPKIAYKGVPQGGVLSPLLYIIFVANIIKNISSRVSISQFADDIALYSNNLKSLQKAVDQIKTNLTIIDLLLAPEKTIFIHFNNKNIKPGETVIKVDNLVIKSSKSIKFLGVIFDYKLIFIPQINKVISRCARASNLIKYLQGIWWGADPTTLLTLYKSYDRSIIEYALYVYYPKRKEQQVKLERIQFNAIRLALGFRKTTPTRILLAESKLPTIHERAKFLCNTYIAKILSNESLAINKTVGKFYTQNHQSKRKKKRIYETCIENVVCLAKNIIKTRNYSIYMYDYSIIMNPVPFKKITELKRQQNTSLKQICNDFNSPNSKIFYTDGSRSESALSTGSACVDLKENIVINRSLNKKTSIFTAECIAVRDALDLALHNTDTCNIIMCDSLSLLERLQNPMMNIKTNPYLLDIKLKYFQFQDQKSATGDIQIYWIPSHSAITGNEIADAQAKHAASRRPVDLDKLPFSDLKESFKCNMKDNTKMTLSNTDLDKGKRYFDRYYKDCNKPWFQGKKLSREFIITINRLRANHYNLNASLARMSIIGDASCPCSYPSQDIEHILWDCPTYYDQRIELYAQLSQINLQFPLSIEAIIKEPDIAACSRIINFLKKCSLRI
ncbi:uncharacterized protein LOC131668300 [Phymastichus coffea]|uniref:uncharacterized protein LOC131668300 n=1 Tax=Phymastichus coffea TaxID=108790 RepID=UPI00273B7CAE|nr:uncharacterized protein LOC131668300 [Phymastichus coffea]